MANDQEISRIRNGGTPVDKMGSKKEFLLDRGQTVKEISSIMHDNPYEYIPFTFKDFQK